MPPKKITYPRYFRGTEGFEDTVIVFPAEGSLGTAYFLDLKQWSRPFWKLQEMNQAPVDEEIVRWQAVALGVPTTKLPEFKAEPTTEEL